MNKNPLILVFAFLLSNLLCVAQDSAYTRFVLKTLCSEKLYGRGYVKKGINKAEKFLVSELKKNGCSPLFGESFTQTFHHSVNTFPSDIVLKLNGKKLKCGEDFIPGAENGSLKGKCRLNRLDSSTYTGAINGSAITVRLKDKLTYSVGRQVKNQFSFEINKNQFRDVPSALELQIQNKFIENFSSKNIGCYIPGSSSSDSCIVFTAHYDHLGGIGKHTFFPGANDNASGVSMLLNLMRYYKEHQPEYKILFIFFAGEEAGLLGSEFLSSSNAIDIHKIKFLVNLDLLGTGEEGIMVVNGAVFNSEFAVLEKINQDNKLLPQIKKRGKAANSDHYWFTEKGVPCFFIYTMGGIKAYHDVYDREKTLPLTKYKEVFLLLTRFVEHF